MRKPLWLFVLAVGCSIVVPAAQAAPRPNVLIITVDDMSADSLGAFGCKLAETSPTIDRLARAGIRFQRAHVVVGNCFPSRNVMWSGMYPHNTGVEGFYQVRNPKHLHLADLMQSAGYFTGIQHKAAHSTPYAPYPAWDIQLDRAPDGTKRDVKAPQSYGEGLAQGIQAARAAGKPFCLMMNVADPHKPFYAENNRGETIPDPNVPSRVFTPAEVPVPGFLFDDPVVRKELSHYYSSVRRADDCVAAILAALDASGQRDNTIILFLSDHGMALPFAKTQVYHHSTNTPLAMIVPGITKPNMVDSEHLISAVDLLPTLLELTGTRHPGKLDGQSFAPLLRGEKFSGRDYVIKEYNENAGGSRDPMRALQTKQFLYIFSPWSNGTRIMATATTGTPTYRRMAQLAKTDPAIDARHKLYQFRVPEELYDIENDPDCLHNLIAVPEQRTQLNALRDKLESWMVETNDPMLVTFRHRDDAAAREAYVEAQEKEAAQRRAGGERKEKGKGKKGKQSEANQAAAGTSAGAKSAVAKSAGGKPPRPNAAQLISLALPERVVPGQPVTVKIEHSLPDSLGQQVLTVTLKGGPGGKRLDRKTVVASGKGTATVTFDVPAEAAGHNVSFAAFVGKDFQANLQYIQSRPLPTR